MCVLIAIIVVAIVLSDTKECAMGSGVRRDGEGTTPPGLLPLDPEHPDVAAVLHEGDIDDEYEVEKDPIAR